MRACVRVCVRMCACVCVCVRVCVQMTLADAITGAAIGPIHSLTGQELMLHPPADLVIMPEMVFKVLMYTTYS